MIYRHAHGHKVPNSVSFNVYVASFWKNLSFSNIDTDCVAVNINVIQIICEKFTFIANFSYKFFDILLIKAYIILNEKIMSSEEDVLTGKTFLGDILQPSIKSWRS